MGERSGGPCKHISTCYFQFEAAYVLIQMKSHFTAFYGKKYMLWWNEYILGLRSNKQCGLIVLAYFLSLTPLQQETFYFSLLLDLIQRGTFISKRNIAVLDVNFI